MFDDGSKRPDSSHLNKDNLFNLPSRNADRKSLLNSKIRLMADDEKAQRDEKTARLRALRLAQQTNESTRST